MFPQIFAISLTSLLICRNTAYTLRWVPYVSCSKFVTNLSQDALCLIHTPLLVHASFLSYSILSSSFSETNQISYDVFFVSVKCFIWSSTIFKIFPRFISLFFLNFHMVLILVYIVSFPILSQHPLHLFLYRMIKKSLCTWWLQYVRCTETFWSPCIFRMKFHSLCVQPSSAFITEKSYFKKFFLLYWNFFSVFT